jgi:glycosyltransferase involved in cell wall biosynthesis
LKAMIVIPGRPGGIEMIFSRRQAEALGALGVDVRQFLLDPSRSFSSLLRERRRLEREIRAVAPDLVHAHYGSGSAFLCAVSTSLPLVVTFHGSDLNPVPHLDPALGAATHALSQLAALRADRIICVSEELERRLVWRRDRASVIPMGVDLELFRPRPRDEARRALGWDLEARVVLFNAGNPSPGKRRDLAEAAVAEARKTLPAVRLEPLVSVEPDRVPDYLNAADCLILTSDHEGSSTIVKEALACNLPVVTVEVGDVRARIAGVSPSEIADRAPAALGAALVRVLEGARRSNGRDVVGPLSETAVARRVLDVYEGLLVPPRAEPRRCV